MRCNQRSGCSSPSQNKQASKPRGCGCRPPSPPHTHPHHFFSARRVPQEGVRRPAHSTAAHPALTSTSAGARRAPQEGVR
eukprot:334212-Chlamydomonas_euryale.AAC.1